MSNEKQKPYKSTAENKKNKINFGTWFNKNVSYSNIEPPPYDIDETLQTKFDEIPPEYKTSKNFTQEEIDIIKLSNTKPHDYKVKLLKKLNKYLLSLTIHKIRNPSEASEEDQYSFPTKPTNEERLKHLEYIEQIIKESNKQDSKNKNPITVSSTIKPKKRKTIKTSTPPTGGSRRKTRKSRRQKTYRKHT